MLGQCWNQCFSFYFDRQLLEPLTNLVCKSNQNFFPPFTHSCAITEATSEIILIYFFSYVWVFNCETTASETYFPFEDCFSCLMPSISVFQCSSFLPKADLFHHPVITQMTGFFVEKASCPLKLNSPSLPKPTNVANLAFPSIQSLKTRVGCIWLLPTCWDL